MFEQRELIEIFVDGLKSSIDSIKPSQLIILHVPTKSFREGLKRAGVAANGLAHHQSNPMWLTIRDTLETMDRFFMFIAKQRPLNIAERKQLTTLLEKVLYKAQKAAGQKPMSRQDVLSSLDRRVIH